MGCQIPRISLPSGATRNRNSDMDTLAGLANTPPGSAEYPPGVSVPVKAGSGPKTASAASEAPGTVGGPGAGRDILDFPENCDLPGLPFPV